MKGLFNGLTFLLLSACSMLSVAKTDSDVLAALLKGKQEMAADFVQITRGQQGEIFQQLSGEMIVAAPGKLFWRTEPPFEQIVVSDGKRMQVYDKDLEQVTIHPVSKGAQSTPALLLGGDIEAIDRQFEVFRLGDNAFRLTPRDNSQLFSALELVFSDDQLEVMRIHDASGQTTDITFSHVNLAPDIGDDTFVLSYPEYVDVIDATNGF